MVLVSPNFVQTAHNVIQSQEPVWAVLLVKHVLMDNVKIKFVHHVILAILKQELANQSSVLACATPATPRLINVLDVNLVKNAMVKQVSVKIYALIVKSVIQQQMRVYLAISVQHATQQQIYVYPRS